MEFFGMDVVVPAGDGIQLLVSQTGEDYIPSPVSTQAVTISLDGNSVIGLSTVDRTCEDLFLPPMYECTLNVPWMMIQNQSNFFE